LRDRAHFNAPRESMFDLSRHRTFRSPPLMFFITPHLVACERQGRPVLTFATPRPFSVD